MNSCRARGTKPKKWFTNAAAAWRDKAEIPSERYFQTKVELGWQMITCAKASGLSYEDVRDLFDHALTVRRPPYPVAYEAF